MQKGMSSARFVPVPCRAALAAVGSSPDRRRGAARRGTAGAAADAGDDGRRPARAGVAGGRGRGARGPTRRISWVQSADGDAVRIPTDDGRRHPGRDARCRSRSAPRTTATAPRPAARGARRHRASPRPRPTRCCATPTGLTNQVTVVRVAPDGVGAGRRHRPAAGRRRRRSGRRLLVRAEQRRHRRRRHRAARDWVTPAAGCADPTAMWNEVAASVGFVPGPGKHLMLYVSRAATNCVVRAGGGRLVSGDRRPALRPGHHPLGDRPRARPQLRSRPLLGPAVRRRPSSPPPAGPSPTATTTTSWASPGPSSARSTPPQAARLGVLPAPPQQALTVQGGRDHGHPRAALRSHRHPGPPAHRRRRRRLLARVPDGDRPGRLARDGRRPATGCRPVSCSAAPAACRTPRCCSTAPPPPRTAGTATCRRRCPSAARWPSPEATSRWWCRAPSDDGAVLTVTPAPPSRPPVGCSGRLGGSAAGAAAGHRAPGLCGGHAGSGRRAAARRGGVGRRRTGPGPGR